MLRAIAASFTSSSTACGGVRARVRVRVRVMVRVRVRVRVRGQRG
jgi:hypothetical protein